MKQMRRAAVLLICFLCACLPSGAQENASAQERNQLNAMINESFVSYLDLIDKYPLYPNRERPAVLIFVDFMPNGLHLFRGGVETEGKVSKLV